MESRKGRSNVKESCNNIVVYYNLSRGPAGIYLGEVSHTAGRLAEETRA